MFEDVQVLQVIGQSMHLGDDGKVEVGHTV